jgi:tetratricopeptide (TPR) repeat protein
VALAFYDTTPDARKFPVLMWTLLILAVPVAYYAYGFVDSFAVRSIDKISPFSAHIEEPSEFAQARRMALRGDIDGAVQRYRQYHDDQAVALFEAARLLKSVDRFVEASALLEEVKQRFPDDKAAWAEATYQLARIHESNLFERGSALNLLKEVANKAPNTRWGRLAAKDISRLSALEGIVAVNLPAVAARGAQLPQDPFFKREDARTRFEAVAGNHAPAARPGEAMPPEPPADPFYQEAMRRQQEARQRAAAEERGPEVQEA